MITRRGFTVAALSAGALGTLRFRRALAQSGRSHRLVLEYDRVLALAAAYERGRAA